MSTLERRVEIIGVLERVSPSAGRLEIMRNEAVLERKGEIIGVLEHKVEIIGALERISLSAGRLEVVKSTVAVLARAEQGMVGAQGKSAYQLWLEAGNMGTEAQFLASLKGNTGPAGPMGNGNAFTYVHQQASPLSLWTIEHNLNRYPAPLVFDSAGSQVLFPEIQYPDLNTLILEFSFSFSGRALLN